MNTNDLYAQLGIDTRTLGCVMLDVEPTLPAELRAKIPQRVWYTDPKRGISGPEAEPHVTLLYGLLESAHTWRAHVDQLLADWQMPAGLWISRFEVFGRPTDPYDVVVATFDEESLEGLAEANGLLRALPHVDTFPEYRPHLTIGYVVAPAGRWVAAELNAHAPRKWVGLVGLNYGREG